MTDNRMRYILKISIELFIISFTQFSRILIIVEEYSRNKNTIERTIDLREYLAIFIRDVSTELGHFQTVIQKNSN